MLTRDSILLWIGIAAGLVMFLAGNKPPTDWDYYGWLAFAGYVLSVVAAKLGGSPLAGNNTDPSRVSNILGIKFTKE